MILLQHSCHMAGRQEAALTASGMLVLMGAE
jgi:hypothetical protein